MLVAVRRPVLQLQLSLVAGRHVLGSTVALNRLHRAACSRSLIGTGALSRAHPHALRHRDPRRRRRSGRGPARRASTCARRRAFAFALGGALAAAGGVLIAMFLDLQRHDGRRLHHEGADRRHHGRRRQRAGALVAGPAARPCRDRGRAPRRSRPHARGHLRAVPRRAAVAADRACSGGRRDEACALGRRSLARRSSRCSLLRAAVRQRLSARARHQHSVLHRAGDRLGAVLRPDAATSRSRPSRSSASAPTRSPCSARSVPWPARARGGRRDRHRASRWSSGLSTLRLSGIYFVIFTFGLAELIRQLVTWYEINVTGSVGRYIFLEHHDRADLLAAARARRARASSPAG